MNNQDMWNPQYKTLDHWRGIAAFWVVMFHGFVSYNQLLHPIVEPLRAVAIHGKLGVSLFFTISGYCIAASAYKLTLKNGIVSDFLKNRLWRIFPTYWAAFLIAIIISLISTLFTNTTVASSLLPSWQSWFGHIFLIQPYIGVENYIVVYWTLSVELAFYLTVAILLLIGKKINHKFAMFCGLVLGFTSVFTPLNARLIFLTFWCEFICGCLLFSALLAKSQNKYQQQKISICLIILLGLLGVWVNFNFKESNLWFSAMFAIVLYILYGIDKKIDSIPQLNWLKFLGIMSYSLYLMHVPFQVRVLALGVKFIPINSPLFLLLQIFGWAVAIAGAWIFYRLVEKPINNLKYQRKKINPTV
jgi:peptidoglycan/LPS O-acetylase OafA/YrhL